MECEVKRRAVFGFGFDGAAAVDDVGVGGVDFAAVLAGFGRALMMLIVPPCVLEMTRGPVVYGAPRLLHGAACD